MNHTIIIAGIAVVAVAALGLLVRQDADRNQVNDSPSVAGEPYTIELATPTPSSTLLFSPTATPTSQATPAATPTVAALRITVTPPPAPTPSATPAATPTSEQIVLGIDAPATVRAGQSFTVTWRISGPAGRRGESSQLTATYQVSQTKNGSSANVDSKTSQSFGAFTVPASFDTTLSLGSMPGEIKLHATATVNGRTLEANRTVQLID